MQTETMFIISLNYKKPFSEIETLLVAHRAFLDDYYQQGIFVMSGPKHPRTGGIIVANIKTREKLEKIIQEDPFYQHDIADYEVVEFTPTKHQLENFYTLNTHD